MDLPRITALGCDPGLRHFGLSLVDRFPDGSYASRGVRVSYTEPNHEKAFTRLRSSADEQRRLAEHFETLAEAMARLSPTVIGVENYTVFEPADVRTLRVTAQRVVDTAGADAQQIRELSVAITKSTRAGVGLGQAAKTIAVYGGVHYAACVAKTPLFVFEPHDRTTRIGGRRNASKEDIGRAVLHRVAGLEEAIRTKVPQKTRWEHVWDATAYAILAAEEYVRMRLDVRS